MCGAPKSADSPCVAQVPDLECRPLALAAVSANDFHSDTSNREDRDEDSSAAGPLVVKRLEEEEKTKGGIIIPDTAKEKPIEGEVVAVGNGKVLEDGKVRPLDVKAGDRVLFGKYSGTEVKIDGEEHLILREDDILGVIEK